MGTGRIRIKDIAREAGVSTATVSRVLNNSNKVTHLTRKKVWEAIEKLGYAPNHVARSLRVKRVYSIGLIVPHDIDYLFSFPYFNLFMHHLAMEAKERGYHIIFTTSDGDESVRLHREFAMRKMVDGLVILDVSDNDPRIDVLDEIGFPFVVIGRPEHNRRYLWVDTENEKGAYRAVEYLVQLGHKRIHFVNGPTDLAVSRQRFEGYLKALHRFGLDYKPSLVHNGEFTEKSGYEVTKKILASNKVEAIFYASDTMAIGGMRALKEKGFNPGKDVSVIGFDDIPSASVVNPPLTTVAQPISHVGSWAAKLLINRIEGKEVSSKSLPVKLKVRGSTIGGV
ncbi:MAG: hypothetical protein PWP09_1685 [Thermotogota bacterium]|nr:hypothetical protein [Thermotogota bacterium]